MITVTIFSDDELIGEMEISRVSPKSESHPDYSAKIAVDNGEEVAVYQRVVHGHRRKHFNVLSLIEYALQELDPTQFLLKGDIDAPRPSDMARRQPRLMREIQAWASKLRDN